MHASNRKTLALTLSASLLLPLFLAVLVEFCCWSVLNEVMYERSSHFGMTSPMTVITSMDASKESKTASHVSTSAKTLRSYLREKSVSAVIYPADNGYPGLQYYSPSSNVSSDNVTISWTYNLPLRCREIHHACLIEGSWSQSTFTHRGSDKTALPLVDPSLSIAGTCEISDILTGDIQYVTPLGSVPLVAGTAIVGTTNPGAIRHIIQLLSSAGEEVQSVQSINKESIDLLQDSSVVMSGLLLLCGAFCAMECWFVLMSEQGHSFTIRRLFGARTSQIVGQFLQNEVPHILLSTLCGSVLPLAVMIPGSQLQSVSLGHIPVFIALPVMIFIISLLLRVLSKHYAADGHAA